AEADRLRRAARSALPLDERRRGGAPLAGSRRQGEGGLRSRNGQQARRAARAIRARHGRRSLRRQEHLELLEERTVRLLTFPWIGEVHDWSKRNAHRRRPPPPGPRGRELVGHLLRLRHDPLGTFTARVYDAPDGESGIR